MQGRTRDADVENRCLDMVVGALTWEIRVDVCALPCVKQIASGDLLQSSGSSAQCSVMTWIDGQEWDLSLKREGYILYL